MYRAARGAGCSHGELVGAVTVHGLPAELFNRVLTRMTATPDTDVPTVVFETVAGDTVTVTVTDVTGVTCRDARDQ